jgi:glycosyltransferase involved in cell wall biosynthesis
LDETAGDDGDRIDLSLVIPCYNEAPHLVASVQEIAGVLDRSDYSYELIFVEDCSTDDTRRVLDGLRSKFPSAQFILHEVNRGRGRTVNDGLLAARGDVAGYLDIDLEVGARFIPDMINAIVLQGYDVATGLRTIEFSFMPMAILRYLLSIGYRALFRLFLGIPIRDPETGCKFFRRQAVLPILEYANNAGWFWDTQIMTYSYLNGLKIREVPCLFVRRSDKKSTIRVFSYTLRQFRELLQLSREIRAIKKKRPARGREGG